MINDLTTLIQGLNITFLGEVMTLRSSLSGDLTGTITNGQEPLEPTDNYITCGAEFISDSQTKSVQGKWWQKKSRWNLIVMKCYILESELIPIIGALQDKKLNGYIFNCIATQRINENQLNITLEIINNYDPNCLCC